MEVITGMTDSRNPWLVRWGCPVGSAGYGSLLNRIDRALQLVLFKQKWVWLVRDGIPDVEMRGYDLDLSFHACSLTSLIELFEY